MNETPSLMTPDEWAKLSAENRHRYNLLVQEIQQLQGENARLLSEVERLNAELNKVRIALGKAAMEINVVGPVDHRIRVLRAEMSETNAELFAELERLTAENARLRRVLMNIESAKRLHSGIPWEAMVMTLQDIARQGLKGGEG